MLMKEAVALYIVKIVFYGLKDSTKFFVGSRSDLKFHHNSKFCDEQYSKTLICKLFAYKA